MCAFSSDLVNVLFNIAAMARQHRIHLFEHPGLLKLAHLSLASLLWDIGKQNSPRCDAAERGVPSGAILFA